MMVSRPGFFPLLSQNPYPSGAIFRGRPYRAEGAFARICAHRACQNLAARAGFVPHLPVFPVRADSGDSGMIAKPTGSFGPGEFLKISIKFDKIR